LGIGDERRNLLLRRGKNSKGLHPVRLQKKKISRLEKKAEPSFKRNRPKGSERGRKREGRRLAAMSKRTAGMRGETANAQRKLLRTPDGVRETGGGNINDGKGG